MPKRSARITGNKHVKIPAEQRNRRHHVSSQHTVEVSTRQQHWPTFPAFTSPPLKSIYRVCSNTVTVTKAPSILATMSKQHCRTLQVERFFRQCRILLRHCCRFCRNKLNMFNLFRLCRKDEISFDIVAVCGNKVECCFDKVERCFDNVACCFDIVDGALGLVYVARSELNWGSWRTPSGRTKKSSGGTTSRSRDFFDTVYYMGSTTAVGIPLSPR